MVRLTDEVIINVLNLQRQLLERIDEATATLFILLEQYDETDETIPELDELQSIRERADTYYTRFYVTLRRIYESQPIAPRDTLELLARYIDESEVTVDAIGASIQEIKRNWNLP